jgi:prophage regulatory protein
MKFLRVKQVMQVTGLSRMTIYRLELAGEFPKRRQLSKNSVAWWGTAVAGRMR